jgi:UDP-N-acetylmuramoylalanine--D-glutamate ligase
MTTTHSQSANDGLIASTARRVVVGLGTTGLSVARFLAARGEAFAVVDTRAQPPGEEALRRELPQVALYSGDVPQSVLDTAAELIVSPGLALDLPFLVAARDAGAHIVGDIDLFMAAATAPVIGITGSNAKSTVTALVGAMAAAAGKRVGVGGNLGTPALDLLDPDCELYVLELSSFQLERSDSLGLDVACVLNLTPDHLDRHGDMQRYHQAKHRIFRGARQAVVNSDDPLTIPPMAPERGVVAWRPREPDLHGFGIHRDEAGREWLSLGHEDLLPIDAVALPGRHNLDNALAALAIGHAAGLPHAAMFDALRTFTGLPHRCQQVCDADGVRWIDDSKATNVAAASAAITGLGSEGPLVLIAGGRGKGGDYRALAAPVAQYCRAVLLIGETAEQMATDLADAPIIERCESLEAAVARAAELAQSGDSVLLSPACASFDMFRDYLERGERFAAAALRVTGGQAS